MNIAKSSRFLAVFMLFALLFPPGLRSEESSSFYTRLAWNSLSEGRFEKVHEYAGRVLELYGKKASEQQASLTDYPLEADICKNQELCDVAACLFLKGRAYYVRGRNTEARACFEEILQKYPYALSKDESGLCWKVAQGAKDQIVLIDTGIDFGDYTSQTLTIKAWRCLNTGRYDEALVFARKCISLYRSSALEMQKKLSDYPSGEKTFDFWALNDVGTCYFIMGEVSLSQNDLKGAEEAFETLSNDYSFAQCYDPSGQFFWKPSEQARLSLQSLRDK